MNSEKRQKPSALYECINEIPAYADQATPLQVPIQYLAGRQMSVDYKEKSIREVKELYANDADVILKVLVENPIALCAVLYANSLSFIILNGHTRARLLPTANGIKAIPSLVYSPEIIVDYLKNEKNEQRSVEDYVSDINSQANETIKHFEMLMGDKYIAPQSVFGARSLHDLDTLERHGITPFVHRSVARR